MEEGLISIIVPIFNAENSLEKCLNSLIDQTYKNIEIILINDGSTDRSLEICNKYEVLDSRIKVLNNKNKGVSKSRNEGIKIAKGEYIQFVDSDDYIESDACNTLINSIRNSCTELVICGLNIIKNDKVIRNPHVDNRIINVKEKEEDLLYVLKILNSPCNKLYKRDKIRNLFDENIDLGEDLIFNLNYISEIDSAITINKCLYNVILDNEESLNRKFDKFKINQLINLFQKEQKIYTDMYGDHYNKGFWHERIIRSLVSNLIQATKILSRDDVLYILNEDFNQKFINEIFH
ncbi:glycosyltransferase family 2 protein, partial [Clostridium sp.]